MIAPKSILEDVKSLLRLPPSTSTEVRKRTILSRSYYAAFHHVQKHPVSRGFKGRSEDVGVHRSLLRHLRASGDRDTLYAAHLLGSLYEWRIIADYRLDQGLRAGIEQTCAEDAEAILDEVLPLG